MTYIVDRNINYTNVCVADCRFCAFYRRPKHPEGYTLSFEEIGRKIDEAKAIGAVQILMQGGHNPYIPFDWYLDLLHFIKREHPIHIHGFSPSEVQFFARRFRMSVDQVVEALQAAGLDSIPGGGGEILVDRVRKMVAPKKAMTDEWLEVMDSAHRHGMKTTCAMTYGLGETSAERIEHLLRLREQQARTGGLAHGRLMRTHQQAHPLRLGWNANRHFLWRRGDKLADGAFHHHRVGQIHQVNGQ